MIITEKLQNKCKINVCHKLDIPSQHMLHENIDPTPLSRLYQKILFGDGDPQFLNNLLIKRDRACMLFIQVISCVAQ